MCRKIQLQSILIKFVYIVMPYIAIVESVDEPNKNADYKFYIEINIGDYRFESFELKYFIPVDEKIKQQ